jgi:hypothetical protein
MTRRDPLRRLRSLWLSFRMYSGVHKHPGRHMLDAICENSLRGFFQYDFQSSSSPITGSNLPLWLAVRTHTLIPQVSEADPYVPQTADQPAHLHSNQTLLCLPNSRTCFPQPERASHHASLWPCDCLGLRHVGSPRGEPLQPYKLTPDGRTRC